VQRSVTEGGVVGVSSEPCRCRYLGAGKHMWANSQHPSWFVEERRRTCACVRDHWVQEHVSASDWQMSSQQNGSIGSHSCPQPRAQIHDLIPLHTCLCSTGPHV
jgi:hypothetical protein